MALPSFSFGAEGVEYGRAASYYATSAGNEVFPDDVEVQGNLTVEGSTTLRGTAVNGTLTVTQSATGGTRTAYLTNGSTGAAEKSVAVFNDQPATLLVMRNNGNSGDIGLDAGVTGGQFTLSKPVNIPVLGGASSGNLTVGGSALVSGNLGCLSDVVAGAKLFVTQGIYGANPTTPPSFPIGFTSGVPLPAPTYSFQNFVLDVNSGPVYNEFNITGTAGVVTIPGSPYPFTGITPGNYAVSRRIRFNSTTFNEKTNLMALFTRAPFSGVSPAIPSVIVLSYVFEPTLGAFLMEARGVGALPNDDGTSYEVRYVIFQGL